MEELRIPLSEELKQDIEEFPEVDWVAIVREALIAKAFALQLSKSKALQKAVFKTLIAKSKLTEKDAKELANKVNEGMFRELKKQYPKLL